jgi:DNA-binding transcriptional MerR regulator
MSADGPVIPDKLFFRIGEVSRLTGLKAHVLRYWESEFPSVRPVKNPAGQRMYRRRDVESLLAIKELLYGQKFTIEGARKHLGKGSPSPPPRGQLELEFSRKDLEELIRKLKKDLQSLRKTIQS